MDDTRKMNVTSESDESVTATTTNDTSSSPTIEDEHNEQNGIQNSTPLKKGPWTASEDAILVEYVRQKGEGNWNAVHRNTELARCGKSCRLRWTNHLKPDLKKGAFTPEEEMRIIQLHAQMGNKWARMAAELPGRTDNEIKNFWNTRAKKRKREGLDIYPSDLSFEPLNGNRVNDPINPLTSSEGNNPPMMNEANKFPLAKIKIFDPNKYLLTISGRPSSASKPQDVRSFYTNKDPLFSNVCPSSCIRGSGPVSPCAPSLVTQTRNGGYPQIQENPACSPLYSNNVSHNQDPYSNRVMTPPSSVILVRHASVNGGIACSSDPNAQAITPELPSSQKQNGTWDTVLPSFESDDVFAQTLPFEDHIVTTRNSGLLDAVIHGSSRANRGSLDSVFHGSSQADDGLFHGSPQANGGLFHGSSRANDGLLDAVIRGSSRSNGGLSSGQVFHQSLRANGGLLDDVIRGPSQADGWLSGQALHGPSQAMNNTKVDWANNNPIRDPKEIGSENQFVPPISSSPSIFSSEETPLSANLSLDELDLMDNNNSGDDLIFPDVSLNGLAMPYDDDFFLGFDRFFESVPGERTSQDSFTNRGI